MPNIDLDLLTPDVTLPATAVLFGADDQVSGPASVYPIGAVADALITTDAFAGLETYAIAAEADRAAIVAMGSVPAAPYLLDGLPPAAIISAPRDAYMLNGAYVPLSSLLTFSSAQKYTIGADGKYKLNAGNGPAYEWSGGRSRLLIEANPSTNYWPNSEDCTLWPNAIGYVPSVTPGGLGAIAVQTLTATAIDMQATAFAVVMTAGSWITKRFLIKSTTGAANILVGFYGTVSEFGASGDTTVRIVSGPATVAAVPGFYGLWKLNGLSATTWSEIEVTRHVLVAETMLHELYAQGVSVGQTLTLARCQVEKTDYSSSYTPCGASPTTRPADVVTAAPGLLALLQGNAATVAVRGTTQFGGASPPLIASASRGNGVLITTTQAQAYPGPLVASLPSVSADFGVVAGYSPSGRKLVANGGTVVTDTGELFGSTDTGIQFAISTVNGLAANMILDDIIVWPFYGADAGSQDQARVYP